MQYMQIETRAKPGRVRVTPSWQFELLLWAISSGFPLANRFDLPGSESMFDISQDPPMCA